MSHHTQARLQRDRRRKATGVPADGPSPCTDAKISGCPGAWVARVSVKLSQPFQRGFQPGDLVQMEGMVSFGFLHRFGLGAFDEVGVAETAFQ